MIRKRAMTICSLCIGDQIAHDSNIIGFHLPLDVENAHLFTLPLVPWSILRDADERAWWRVASSASIRMQSAN